MKERGLGTGAIVAIVVVVVAAVVVGVMAAVFLLGGGGLGSLPLYPGAQKTAENTINGIQAATYTVPASPSDVISWYKSQMAGQGWTPYQEADTMLIYTKGNDGAIISAWVADGTTQLGLGYGPKDTLIYYMTSATPSALVTGTAENSGDDIVFTPSSEMTPSTIPTADWEYAVYTSAGAQVTAFTAGTTGLERGIPVTLSAAGGDSGDTLKIRYKGSQIFEITIF